MIDIWTRPVPTTRVHLPRLARRVYYVRPRRVFTTTVFFFFVFEIDFPGRSDRLGVCVRARQILAHNQRRSQIGAAVSRPVGRSGS